MKSNSFFSAIILIGFGLYFLLAQLNVAIVQTFLYWPTLLCIIGLAFLLQFFKSKNYELILPGTILFGLGIHFHAVLSFGLWQNELGIILFIVSLGLLLQSLKSRNGLVVSLLMFFLSMFLVFNESVISLLATLGISLSVSFSLWPFLLIAVGILLLFMKK